MKKYLLLVEDEELWEKFKKTIDKDINTELISLIERALLKKDLGEKRIKTKKGGKNDK